MSTFPSKPGERERLQNLDVVRGVAALSVMLFHLSSLDRVTGMPGFDQARAWGWAGVEAFFVVSGFVVPMTVWQSPNGNTRAQFFLRRMIRLAGPFWMAAILVVGLSWLSAAVPGYRGADFVFPGVMALACHLLYACDALNTPWLNPVFWTLAVEVQFYLLVALLFPFAHSKRGRLLIGLVIAVMLLLAPVAPEHSVFPYLPLFLLGFLGLIWRRRALPLWLLAVCAITLLSTIASWLGWVECLAALLTIAFILRSDRAWAPLVWLGGISYSIYLVHVPVGVRIMNLANRMDLQGAWLYLALLIACASTIAAAWMFWRFVELPCLRWSRSIGSAAPRLTQLPSSQGSSA